MHNQTTEVLRTNLYAEIFIVHHHVNSSYFTALFYYTLGNISPMYRSTLKCIQLLAITKSSVLQAYGVDQILENVMKDVKQLEKASF